MPDPAVVAAAVEYLKLLRAEHIFAYKLGSLDDAGNPSADNEAETLSYNVGRHGVERVEERKMIVVKETILF
jgi:hypothetical protein